MAWEILFESSWDCIEILLCLAIHGNLRLNLFVILSKEFLSQLVREP